jgi:hypothetical protein
MRVPVPMLRGFDKLLEFSAVTQELLETLYGSAGF